MSKRWRVDYQLREPIAVDQTVPGYPSLGVTFSYDSDRKLVRAYHDIEVDTESEEEALAASQRALLGLWEALGFLRTAPLPFAIPTIQQQGASVPALRLRGIAKVSFNAFLVREIAMPSEAAITQVQDRFAEWLYIMNRAIDNPSDSAALRDYYMVWEDMVGRPSNTDAEAWLKLSRDFVSHGEKLDNEKVIDFVEKEIGRRDDQFEPSNPEHQKAVRKWRDQARALVEPRLRSKLR